MSIRYHLHHSTHKIHLLTVNSQCSLNYGSTCTCILHKYIIYNDIIIHALFMCCYQFYTQEYHRNSTAYYQAQSMSTPCRYCSTQQHLLKSWKGLNNPCSCSKDHCLELHRKMKRMSCADSIGLVESPYASRRQLLSCMQRCINIEPTPPIGEPNRLVDSGLTNLAPGSTPADGNISTNYF